MDQKGHSRFDTVLGALLLIGMIMALYMAFLQAPREQKMGDLQRIFYFHVPAGMTGLTALAVNFVASLMYLIKKDRKWDGLALSAAEIGLMFLAIVLVTGSIWAKPEWFVWWTWSARLTFSLVLCLLYVAYILVRNYVPDSERRAMMSAVFGIVAFVDAPIVWFSIRWWSDQYPPLGLQWERHPQPMLETGGLDPAMRPALWTCWAAFQLLLIYVMRRRFYLECLRQDVEWLERRVS